jgi:hypothetical protein
VKGRIAVEFCAAVAPVEVLPELAGDGLCDQEDEVKLTMATIMRSVVFMRSFPVELLSLRFTSVLSLAQPFR